VYYKKTDFNLLILFLEEKRVSVHVFKYFKNSNLTKHHFTILETRKNLIYKTQK